MELKEVMNVMQVSGERRTFPSLPEQSVTKQMEFVSGVIFKLYNVFCIHKKKFARLRSSLASGCLAGGQI